MLTNPLTSIIDTEIMDVIAIGQVMLVRYIKINSGENISYGGKLFVGAKKIKCLKCL